MNKEELGAFIAQNRKSSGLTQRELAERLHVTDKAVSKWERGLSYPDVTLLEPLAEVLGIGVEELVSCEKREEEPPVKAVLKISRENRKTEQRRTILRTVLTVLVMLGVALAVIWYLDTYVQERRENTIFLKETEGGVNYLYVEQEGHLLRLKCGAGVDFDGIAQTDERGNELFYRLDCRWNRKTYKGTVNACEETGMYSLGGLMDADFEVEGVPFLFGEPVVFYTSENYYPDPYGEPRGRVYLCDFRFFKGVLNEKSGVWTKEEELLFIEDCMNIAVADFDGDGEQEVIARTRWPEKPYTVYKQVDGEITTLWPETVPEEVRKDLRCIWENE